MTENNLPHPTLITRLPALAGMVERLLQEPIVAVDTESNSLFAYQERVCLIQFSIPGMDYLVDPLALPDLTPLGSVFADPKIEKVFHAADYDLLCLRRDYDFTFANLFDTMLAARILGREALGLAALLEAEFGVLLDKRYQRANWGQRPLPAPLLSYARLDTHYLIALRQRLLDALQQAGRLPLAMEDFHRMCLDNYTSSNGSPDPCMNISGIYELEPQKVAVLKELCAYRDQMAQRMDRPLFKVIGDKTLMAIAEACPTSLDGLHGLPGMTPKQIKRHGPQLLQAVHRGLKAAPIRVSHPPRANDAYLLRLDALRQWRKVAGKAMGVESDVVLPRDLMYMLAEKNPRHPQELADLMRIAPYRLEHFGSDLARVLRIRSEPPTGANK
ncbi:MAG: HRDC domain-containing protein [Anaerolineales bacterium]|jgi:ribonuclease D|nr:HRDC domain-containing protein [Anaerolineales bacterium]